MPGPSPQGPAAHPRDAFPLSLSPMNVPETFVMGPQHCTPDPTNAAWSVRGSPPASHWRAWCAGASGALVTTAFVARALSPSPLVPCTQPEPGTGCGPNVMLHARAPAAEGLRRSLRMPSATRSLSPAAAGLAWDAPPVRPRAVPPHEAAGDRSRRQGQQQSPMPVGAEAGLLAAGGVIAALVVWVVQVWERAASRGAGGCAAAACGHRQSMVAAWGVREWAAVGVGQGARDVARSVRQQDGTEGGEVDASGHGGCGGGASEGDEDGAEDGGQARDGSREEGSGDGGGEGEGTGDSGGDGDREGDQDGQGEGEGDSDGEGEGEGEGGSGVDSDEDTSNRKKKGRRKGQETKEERKARKEAAKAAKKEQRDKRAGVVDEGRGQKECTLCRRPMDVLIRCQVDESKTWHMVCGKCWKEVSGGVEDGDAAHPHYRYGGVWKNHAKPEVTGKKKKNKGKGKGKGKGSDEDVSQLPALR